jgi:hypothetical protein
MGEDAARSVTAVSPTAARLSFAAAATFLALLAALHLLKPEVDPSWRMVSEYEIGRYGWMMLLAFLSLAFSCVALVVAVRSQLRTVVGRIGLALLLVSASGMTIAAIFTSDPITASQSELTTHGNLHGMGALLGIPSFPVAAALISRSLARYRASRATARSEAADRDSSFEPQAGLRFGRDFGYHPRGAGHQDLKAKICAYTYAFYINRMLDRPQAKIKELWA